MDSILLSQSKLEKFLTDGMKDLLFNDTDSRYSFNTTIGLLQVLEVLKKRGIYQHSTLKNNLHNFCNSGVCQLDLDQYEMVQALEDPEFNWQTNVLSIAYNDNCWGDKDELLKQL